MEELTLKELLKNEVKQNYTAGIQMAVYEQGEEIFCFSEGMADREKGVSLDKHTLMRLYSMTKPVTAVAANILKERGCLDFDRPVADYLPEFSQMKVIREGRLEPASHPILIKHLLSMTSGIVYPDLDECGRYMEDVFCDIHAAIRKGCAYSTREVVRKIADAPLDFEPGEGWRYGLSVDILGAVVEVVSGIKLSEFFEKEIFSPLEMYDTAFYVPTEKQYRFAQLYKRNIQGELEIDSERHLGLTLCLEPPAYEAAGAGLISTLEDYSHFAGMLANKGEWKGVRILEDKTVESFMQNYVPVEWLQESGLAQMAGYGYGNCMRVNLGNGKSLSKETEGEFGWDGWSGPYVSIDTVHNRVILLMQQVSGFDHWDFIWKIRNEVLD